MVRPTTNDDINRAVTMVANGAKARDAWEACGCPNGEKAIQNIRQRGLARKRSAEEPGQPEEPALEPELLPPQKKKQYKVYANARQTEQENARKRKRDDERKEIFKAATRAVAAAKVDGSLGKPGSTYKDIAARHQVQVPEGARPITGPSLMNHGNRHVAGTSPKKTGPAPKLPDALFRGAASFVQLKQVAGQEQKPREVMQAMLAAVEGTSLESALASKPQQNRAKRKLRAMEDTLSTQTTVPVEERRHQWLCKSNLMTWFSGGASGGYEACLKEHGFTDENGKIHRAKRRRMLNMDETHHYMGNQGDARGSRANVLVDKRLGRSGRRKVENTSHVTGMHWADYDGEVGAGMYLFDSSATEAEDRRVRSSWVSGLPSTRGYFGFNKLTTVTPSVAVTPKGGTILGTLQQFVETQIYPAYPNIGPEWVLEECMTDDGPDYRVVLGPVFMQVDSGPDRVNDANLDFRIDAARRGLIIFPGLPNGTAANQLMDGVFGTFKMESDLEADRIVAERIAAAEDDFSVQVKLSNDDLPRIMQHAFSHAFGPQAIISKVAQLGLCPVDCERACSHPRVRDDTSDTSQGKLIAGIQTRHAATLASLATQGLNSKALAVKPKPAPKPKAVPDVANVAPRTAMEAAWADTVANGASAGKNWLTVGAHAYNSSFLLSAEVERRRLATAAKEDKVDRELAGVLALQSQARAIESARIAAKQTYNQLKATDLALLVRYEFTARAAKVGTKVTGKAGFIAYLEALPAGTLAAALASPTRLAGLDLSAAKLLLTARSGGFGDVGITLPQGLSPIAAPAWLENALDPSRPESGQLAGRSILFHWAEGGWAVGVLDQPNTNKRYKVDGATANFRASYECDGKTASHVLSLTGYASDSDADTESWVLLGRPEGEQLRLTGAQQPPSAAPLSARKLSKQPLLPSTTTPQAGLCDAEVDELSHAEVAALMLRLAARMSGASSSCTPP